MARSTSVLKRRLVASFGALALAAGGVTTLGLSSAAAAPSGAAFTSTNSDADGDDRCRNGNYDPDVNNCNIYTGKQYVWLNGGPQSAGLADGTYFFAVLSPSGQADPNDGTADNLSDDVDTYANRTFSVTGGLVTYTGTHDFNGNRIRLAEYADTTNPGGVYILAICNLAGGAPVTPASCKYDAFKVKTTDDDPGAKVKSVFGGTKYLDSDKDGALDPGESALPGWTITISGGDLPAPATVVTDANGAWTFTTPEVDEAVSGGTYSVCETLQPGWRQTGPASASAVATTGAITVGLTGATASGTRCYTITVPSFVNGVATSLDFFNLPQGDIAGGKYYDGDASGSKNGAEAGISGWKVQISTTADFASATTVTTNALGAFSATLDPGTYYVREARSTSGTWQQTGNTTYQGSSSAVSLNAFVYTVTVSGAAPTTAGSLLFGNLCLGGGGGLTLGFWSNKNGQALVGQGDLDMLVALNLRNGDGSGFNPATAKGLSTWLLNANATNMAYMLSAQLAAMELNVFNEKVAGNALVYAPGTGGAAYLTVNDLMALANASLGANATTIAAGPARTYQEALKTALDRGNNNLSFVQAGAGSCSAPTFAP